MRVGRSKYSLLLLLFTYLYSTGTHHENLLKSLVTVSRVTYFIPRDRTGNCVSTEKVGRGYGKNDGVWPGKVEIRTRQKILAVVEACVAIF